MFYVNFVVLKLLLCIYLNKKICGEHRYVDNNSIDECLPTLQQFQIDDQQLSPFILQNRFELQQMYVKFGGIYSVRSARIDRS